MYLLAYVSKNSFQKESNTHMLDWSHYRTYMSSFFEPIFHVFLKSLESNFGFE